MTKVHLRKRLRFKGQDVTDSEETAAVDTHGVSVLQPQKRKENFPGDPLLHQLSATIKAVQTSWQAELMRQMRLSALYDMFQQYSEPPLSE